MAFELLVRLHGRPIAASKPQSDTHTHFLTTTILFTKPAMFPCSLCHAHAVELHAAALPFCYGKGMAVNRHSQLWFGQLGGKECKIPLFPIETLPEAYERGCCN